MTGPAIQQPDINLANLLTNVRQRRRALDQRQGEARALATRGRELKAEVASLKVEMDNLAQVAGLLNSIGEARQNEAQRQIESLVTLGLQTIFDTSLSFHVIQKENVKTAQVEFVIRTTIPSVNTIDLETGASEFTSEPTVIDTSVMDARGGGLAATVGFLLRVVVILLSRPTQGATAQGSLLILDETFSHVSSDYLDRVAEFLKELTERTGIQILMITHQEELMNTADTVYRFSVNSTGKNAGYTKVDKIR